MTAYHYRSTACCIFAHRHGRGDLHCGNEEIRDQLYWVWLWIMKFCFPCVFQYLFLPFFISTAHGFIFSQAKKKIPGFPCMCSTWQYSVQSDVERKEAEWELGECCKEVWKDCICYSVYEEQLPVWLLFIYMLEKFWSHYAFPYENSHLKWTKKYWAV